MSVQYQSSKVRNLRIFCFLGEKYLMFDNQHMYY